MTEPIKRLLEFVDTHGGGSNVAKKAKLSAQVFTNYKNPDRKNENVGGEVHAKMLEAYPDEYSADYIITGYDKIAEIRKIAEREREEKIKIQEYIVKKEMEAYRNFQEVDTSNQLADNLDNIKVLGDVPHNFWAGQTYYQDLSENV